MFKTCTKLEFSGQNDDNNINIKDSLTIASWEISDKTLDAENKKGMLISMVTEKRTLPIELKIFLKMIIN